MKSVSSPSRAPASSPPSFFTENRILALFAITIFVSAFLLFQVQPLISKFILPWFGGSPAVWTAAMLFFQFVLLGGYLYAHLSCTFLSPRSRFYTHLALLGLATLSVLSNRLVPSDALRPQGTASAQPLWEILQVLGLTVGLPYFALSSTGPLLQKWFSELCPHTSPYRLFSLSNVGSLLALVSYPFLFEALWGVRTQGLFWSLAFLVFVAVCGTCATLVLRVEKEEPAKDKSTSAAKGEQPPPSLFEMALWVALPSLASVMFLAVTNEVCQNVATVPLLWIIPLALYLCSFIIAFDHARWYSRKWYAIATLVLLLVIVKFSDVIDGVKWVLKNTVGLSDNLKSAIDTAWWLEALVYFAAMFVTATICHGELASRKPSTRYLTFYFLTISVGGMLGGAFVNLLAPSIFVSFFELTVALTLAAVLAQELLSVPTSSDVASRYVHSWLQRAVAKAGLVAAVLICNWLFESKFYDADTDSTKTLHEGRNFYGLVTVQRREVGDPDERFVFFSGHIQHGMQFASADRRAVPTSYYGEGSGCETAIKFLQRRSPSIRIGVIGLGVGTIATYARETDSLRFYELNPAVVDIAQNEKWFRFLSDCHCKPEIVLGDARLQLEKELRADQPQKFDLLVLDAFTGDAIPTHLVTREAFDLYAKHLNSNGILAFHITNTYLDLYPVVKGLAEHAQFGHRRMYIKADYDRLLYRNYYCLVTRDEAFLQETADELADLPEYLSRPRPTPLWTDDFTHMTGLLR